MTPKRPVYIVIICAVGLLATACSGPGPADSEDTSSDPSEAATQTSAAAPKDSGSASSTQTASREATQSEPLPIDRTKLLGYWQTRGGASEETPFVYHFQEDGSLRVFRGSDTVVLEGGYEITADQALRLRLRDPATGDLQREMTLRLMVRQGHSEYAFEVQPDGGTLWLRRVEPSDSDAPGPD